MGKKWFPAIIGLLLAVLVLALAGNMMEEDTQEDNTTTAQASQQTSGSGQEDDAAGAASQQSQNEGEASSARVTFAEETPLDEKHLRDVDTLYEDEDEDGQESNKTGTNPGVMTMYLTVSTGNEVDGTNHTWEEVNRYSVYDYEKMGVSRYKVEGLLQVGDENGPLADEFGGDQAVPNATVSIRGQSSSQNAQKNYKIRIKKNKGKLDGQRTIDLNKHMGEALRFRNKMGFDMLRKIPQLMSLRTHFVHLYVRDLTGTEDKGFEDYGLYTWVEQLNKAALKAHGLDADGQLYKVNFFEFYRYEDVIKLSTDPDYDKAKFEEYLEIKGSEDHTKLIAMLEDLNDYSIPIEEVIADHFDMENLSYWMAFNLLTGNIDTQSRNMFLYSPLNGSTWYLLCWDLDGSMLYDEQEIRGRQDYASWQQGISNYWGNILFRRLLTSPTFRENLQNAIDDIRENDLTEAVVREMAESYAAVVKPYAFSMPDMEHIGVTSTQYDEIVEGLPELIEFYYEHYQESLEKPMPFYIGTPQKSGSQLVINWDASYDLDNEKLTYTAQIARDPLMQDVVYTYTGEDISAMTDMPQAGQYYLKVSVTNSSGYSQDAFDVVTTAEDGKQFGEILFYIDADGTVTRDDG